MPFDLTEQCCGYDNKNPGKNCKVQWRILMILFLGHQYLDLISRTKYLHFHFLSEYLASRNSLCQSLFFSMKKKPKEVFLISSRKNIVPPMKNKLVLAKTSKHLAAYDHTYLKRNTSVWGDSNWT